MPFSRTSYKNYSIECKSPPSYDCADFIVAIPLRRVRQPICLKSPLLLFHNLSSLVLIAALLDSSLLCLASPVLRAGSLQVARGSRHAPFAV